MGVGDQPADQPLQDVRPMAKCAVVIPVGPGHESLYQQALTSVQTAAQNDPGPFTNFDCVVIDDTAGRKGRSAGRNEGVREAAARGADWLFFLDADDLMTVDAFARLAPCVDRADAVWGLILEAVETGVGEGTVTGRIRIPQLPRVDSLTDLLLHDPFLTLQMGHFVRTGVALANPFDEAKDTGEDFHYYLRVWQSARCLKIPAPLFLNRRGAQSSGPRSANGRDWRSAVENVLEETRRAHGIDPASPDAIAVRNAATLDTQAWQRGFGAVEPGQLVSIARQFPFHGCREVVPSVGAPFVMFDDNDDLVCMSMGWRGAYEPASLRLWQRLAQGVGTVFDIGAYTGVYALMAGRAAPEARVVAVEPVAANFARLTRNRDANGCGAILPVHAAVFDRSGTVTLRRSSTTEILTSGASITRHGPSDRIVEDTVPALTGNDLLELAGTSSVELIKIDVEGAEEQVLAGMAGLIERCGPDLLIECLDERMADAVDRILRPLGYRFHAIDDEAMRVMETGRFTAATGMNSLNRWATRRDAVAARTVIAAAGLAPD